MFLVFQGAVARAQQSEKSLAPIAKSPESPSIPWKQVAMTVHDIPPIPIETYSFAPKSSAHDHGAPIDLAQENRLVSQNLQQVENKESIDFIIVPGFVPNFGGPFKLTKDSQKRLDWAVKLAKKSKHPIFFLTGGNVKPSGTPFNEALEMKKYLMKTHSIPEGFIGMDPYAQSTVTNLRNSGRFMLAHGVKKARITTTAVHNFYIGFSQISSFAIRARWTLGYSLGDLEYINNRETAYHPSEKVLQKSSNKLDP